MPNKEIPNEERRKYKRLDTVIPVEFQILDKELNPVSGWHQGFSQDISKGGMCLTVNDLSKDESLSLKPHQIDLLLQIHSPMSDRRFLAYAKVAWTKKIRELPFIQYLVGLNFSRVDPREINKLLNYVRLKKVLWRMLQILILGTILFSTLVIINNFRLNVWHNQLLEEYSQLLHKDLELNQDYNTVLGNKDSLDRALKASHFEIEALKEVMQGIEDDKNKEINSLESRLEEARDTMIESEEASIRIGELTAQLGELRNMKDKDIEKLKGEIVALKEKEETLKNSLTEAIDEELEIMKEFSIVEKEGQILAQGFKNQLYNWLVTHQVKKTGLIVSFEGDLNLKDVTFVYDQSLAVIAYTIFGDYKNAKKGLDFFLNKAKKVNGDGFYNAYYSKSGDVAEYIAHAGPNLWLGFAVLQYTNKTKDYTYINIARQIANWIESLQDKEGGIIGGKGIGWYSTEHNLDAFSFFNMFYELTKEKEYRVAADKILKWLDVYAYGNESVPVNRGKGDSTIATDTYAWSIAALGPDRLKELNMDPDGILEFAIENCLVTTEFTDRSGDNINVSGFDFAKYQHIARGGVVSCEWTAQMILSFSIMSEYHLQNGQLKKATYYQKQALKFLNELNKMIISSFSSFGRGNWCLPYASQENVDTGHGWRTPKGNRTGSVAATAYTIFAISKYNPLELQHK